MYNTNGLLKPQGTRSYQSSTAQASLVEKLFANAEKVDIDFAPGYSNRKDDVVDADTLEWSFRKGLNATDYTYDDNIEITIADNELIELGNHLNSFWKGKV